MGCNYSSIPNFIDGFNQTVVEFRERISNRISLFYMDVITYPCPNPDAGLADLYLWKGPSRACHPAAILWLLSLYPISLVKCRQLTWRPGTRRFHLPVSYLTVTCSDLNKIYGVSKVIPEPAAGWYAPFHINPCYIGSRLTRFNPAQRDIFSQQNVPRL